MKLVVAFSCSIIAITFFQNGKGDDAVAFPMGVETEDSQATDDSNERMPLYMPSKCPKNQLLYPGDQKADWICDCAPGHIYHPDTDTCFEAYRRGPCKEGQFLVLSKTNRMPKCRRNKCNKEGEARYRQICWELEKTGGPCLEDEIFSVNETSLKLTCYKTKYSMGRLLKLGTRNGFEVNPGIEIKR